MHFRTLIFAATAASIGLLGCQRKTVATDGTTPPAMGGPAANAKVSDTSRLRSAVDAYAAVQNPENDAGVRQAMADIDNEMIGLEDLVAKRHGRDRQKVAAKLRRLESYRSAETTRFAEIQAGAALTAPSPREEAADAGKVAAPPKPVGEAIEEAGQTGDAAKHAIR